MASVEKQELEYESDPEESRLSLTMMRRREASDDEDEEKDLVDGSGMPVRRVDSRVSNCEYDDEGAPAEYNDEEFEVQGEELDGEIDGEYVEERVSLSDVEVVALGLDEVSGINRVEEGEKENDGGVYLEGYDQFGDNVVNERVEGEKKENEPFAVPTAGAFYMHDDRFRESRSGGRGRHRCGFCSFTLLYITIWFFCKNNCFRYHLDIIILYLYLYFKVWMLFLMHIKELKWHIRAV